MYNSSTYRLLHVHHGGITRIEYQNCIIADAVDRWGAVIYGYYDNSK